MISEKDDYREDFSIVDTTSIMDSELPVRNIYSINCGEVDHKNTCTESPDNLQKKVSIL